MGTILFLLATVGLPLFVVPVLAAFTRIEREEAERRRRRREMLDFSIRVVADVARFQAAMYGAMVAGVQATRATRDFQRTWDRVQDTLSDD